MTLQFLHGRYAHSGVNTGVQDYSPKKEGGLGIYSGQACTQVFMVHMYVQ